MEETEEIISTSDSERNIKEGIISNIRGLPNSIYQKRILGAEAGGK